MGATGGGGVARRTAGACAVRVSSQKNTKRPLPDLSFWVDRVHYGTLVSVTVSEHEQGLAAGRMARVILVEGKRPASIPMAPTTKGMPVISLARAKQLGIGIKSSLLLSSQVIQDFEWNKTQ